MILSVSLSQSSHDKYMVCCVSLLHVTVNSSFDKKLMIFNNLLVLVTLADLTKINSLAY